MALRSSNREIFSRNICQRQIRENFVPQKFLAIRYFNIIDCLGFTVLALTIYLIVYAMETKNFSSSVSVCTNVTSSLVFYIVYFVQNLLPSATVSCCSRIGERLPVVTPMEPEVIRLHIILFSCIKINTRSLNK